MSLQTQLVKVAVSVLLLVSLIGCKSTRKSKESTQAAEAVTQDESSKPEKVEKVRYDEFYDQEINFRKALNYPPFSRMIQLKISGKDPALTRNCAHNLGDRCRALKASNSSAFGSVETMGPIESSLSKVARRYRWQILLKGRHARALHQFVSRLLADNPTLFHHNRVRVVVDVDPVSFL